MAQHKTQDRPHHGEVPDARPVKSSHHPGEPGKLNWLPHSETGEHGEHSKPNGGRVSMLLQRVISLANRRLRSKKEIMFHHRPHAGNVTMREPDLTIITAEKLIAEIKKAGRH